MSSISLVYLLLVKSTLALTSMKEAAIGICMDEKKHFLQLVQQILVSLSIQTPVNTCENGIIDSHSHIFQLGSGKRKGSIILGFCSALNCKYLTVCSFKKKKKKSEVSICFALYLEMQFISLECGDCVLITDML